ncbi:hypothetical protein PAPYR_11156 [Paratrimastix pyriformis]|uniref:Uncharacterized protein n=1 Tax=Paratrimastix pyriformis TaxID=342808 RepID=A0ABQ8U7A5_9EUKA|nr:hypothetical protein PAPYR_11156 [Paratrimastix pyriformis]
MQMLQHGRQSISSWGFGAWEVGAAEGRVEDSHLEEKRICLMPLQTALRDRALIDGDRIIQYFSDRLFKAWFLAQFLTNLPPANCRNESSQPGNTPLSSHSGTRRGG